MTGARGLKIANIDKLYIFDMQLFMFLYRGVFFDAALLGVLHCYIVTFVFSEPHEKGVKKMGGCVKTKMTTLQSYRL